MAHILAIDPGRKPGYALLDTSVLVPRRYFRVSLPLIVGWWTALPAVRADVVVAERQWLGGPKRKDAILDLAFTAGWQLACACVQTRGLPHAQDVRMWRQTLRAGGCTKKVLCRRLEASLLPAEAAILPRVSPTRLLDLYDAALIGWADFLNPKPWSTPP